MKNILFTVSIGGKHVIRNRVNMEINVLYWQIPFAIRAGKF
jgi:hypothetical protein